MILTTPIKWQGSKYRQRHNITPIIYRANYDIYVEPFGGGGGMFTGLQHAQPIEEVYNDLNNTVCNFFKVLRDKDKVTQIKELCNLSLYSRRYWYEFRELVLDHFAGRWDLVKEGLRALRLDGYNEDVALAFAFFYVQNAGFAGKFASSFGGPGKPHVRPRGGSIEEQAQRFRNKVDMIEAYFKRFKYVSVENLPYEEIFNRFDSATTLFYCDPPYCSEGSKLYKTPWDNEIEAEFIERAAALRGSVVISCYDTPRYNSLLDKGFKRENFKGLISLNDKTCKESIETVYYRVNEKKLDALFLGR